MKTEFSQRFFEKCPNQIYWKSV